MIPALRERYDVPVGYSGHEVGLSTSLAAVALGACVVERHLTLDRAMWGSDQAASVEPQGLARLVKDIRAVEAGAGRRREARLRQRNAGAAKAAARRALTGMNDDRHHAGAAVAARAGPAAGVSLVVRWRGGVLRGARLRLRRDRMALRRADRVDDNPLWSDVGSGSDIRRLAADTGIALRSVCADYFMAHPFVRVPADERARSVERARRR